MVVSSSISSAATASSSSPSSSSETSNAATATNIPGAGQDHDSSDSSSSVNIGVGVGVGVGGALVLAAMIWFMLSERRKRIAAEKRMETALSHRRYGSEQMPMMTAHPNSSGVGYPAQHEPMTGRGELDAHGNMMAGGRPRALYEVQ